MRLGVLVPGRGPNLEAILITEQGKASQKPLGLVSAADIVNARQRR